MKKTILFNENAGYDCIPNKDFEKYERIKTLKNKGNKNLRYSFECDVNIKKEAETILRDWRG